MNKLEQKLKEPIGNIRWKSQAKVGDKMLMVPYYDARDVQNRLDEVVGVAGWQTSYHAQAGKVFCKLGLNLDGTWIYKEDAGEETNISADKGAASTAFKRAASAFGVGRDAYEMEAFYCGKTSHNGKDYPVDDEGNILWTPAKVSEYINGKVKVE